MSKYSQYISSIDGNRTEYHFGDVGARVVYDPELNQTEIARLKFLNDDDSYGYDYDSSHNILIVDGQDQTAIDEILGEIKESEQDLDFETAAQELSDLGVDLAQ